MPPAGTTRTHATRCTGPHIFGSPAGLWGPLRTVRARTRRPSQAHPPSPVTDRPPITDHRSPARRGRPRSRATHALGPRPRASGSACARPASARQLCVSTRARLSCAPPRARPQLCASARARPQLCALRARPGPTLRSDARPPFGEADRLGRGPRLEPGLERGDAERGDAERGDAGRGVSRTSLPRPVCARPGLAIRAEPGLAGAGAWSKFISYIPPFP